MKNSLFIEPSLLKNKLNDTSVKILDATFFLPDSGLNAEKEYFKFKWQVEKFIEEGPLKDCWLTTAVSSPISMGSSI